MEVGTVQRASIIHTHHTVHTALSRSTCFQGTVNAMSKDTRVVGGHVQYRRFAYLHKRDRSKFGLLEAVDYKNARDHLGKGYHIRTTWLTLEEEHSQGSDRDRRWEIVSSIFLMPGSVAYVGND